ncbi:MAG TPA: carboxy terminal-processing peptidase [Xanthomonadales bacterium]|nr:carboxy terminal-processing peptidase [Xanthomonadales bacterium]
MKKLLLQRSLVSVFVTLSVVLVASAAWALQKPAGDESTEVLLKPTMEQRFASNLATKFLTNYHYKDTRLDDELSEIIFDRYLELLDPNRSYFLASDIQTFTRYQESLDDALRHSDLLPAYDIFNVYRDRVRQRVAYARKRVQEPFDFEIEEEYYFNREDAEWAANSVELDEIWRRRVKNDFLRLKLTDKEEEAIVETLLERYDNLDRRIAELNNEDVFQFFMNAFAQSIEPHTAYLSPRSSENFEISMSLSLEGIGALLGRESEYTTISRVVPGGPASKDGRLKAGDRISGVGQGQDGKIVDVIGWRVDDVVDMIRGPKHTVVRLQVLPEAASAGDPPTMIDIVRDEVKLEEQAAQSELIEAPVVGDDGIERMVKVGVIDLPVFYLDFNGRAQNKPDYRSSTRDVRRLIGELEEQGAEAIVMDLRNNGGGSLLEATTLTGLFINRGPVVQVRHSNGRISVEEDVDPGMAWDGPLVVLVNRYSASASEIFAAAIQDYGRGVLVGEPTFGKGTVQSLLDLDDYAPNSDEPSLGQLKLTMAQFFRVKGGSTQNKGVVPDIRFPSVGNSDDYGESALDGALPWTSIDPARFDPEGDLANLVAVTDNLYQTRMSTNQEFNWLLSDIEEYNEQSEEVSVTLLEAERRAQIERDEAKRKERDGDGDPLISDEDILAATTLEDADEDGDVVVEEEEEEQGPDLLLREAARIAADMAGFHQDMEGLASAFSQLDHEENSSETLN